MAAAITEKIGYRMRERREELGLKQRQVGERTGKASIDGNVISRWERGDVRPSDLNLELIAEALETTVDDLVAGPIADRGGPTPDLGATFDGVDREQLDRIEHRLEAVETLLRRLVPQTAGDVKEAAGPHVPPGAATGLPLKADQPKEENPDEPETGGEAEGRPPA